LTGCDEHEPAFFNTHVNNAVRCDALLHVQ
jgi:hypothetical protein